jgi:hypothetical protein
MANEATLVVRYEDPVNFIVSNTTGIEKGAICKIADPMTASLSTGAADLIAGIAASEKIASDGNTSLGMYRRGIFRVFASGAVSAGTAVCSAGQANYVKAQLTAVSGAKVLGFALETIEDNTAGLIELNIGGNF